MSIAFIFPGQGSQAVGMGAELGSATLTVDARISENLLVRLDNRTDVLMSAAEDDDVFPVGVVDENGPRDARNYQVTTTLGVIVHAD